MSIPMWYLDAPRYKYNYEDLAGTAEEPKLALKKYGPYSKNAFRTVRVGVAMICPDVHRQTGEHFYKAFQTGLMAYKPFHDIYRLSCYYHPITVFQSGVSADQYTAAALELVKAKEQTRADLWICFLMIEDRFKRLPIHQNPYFTARAVLLSNQMLVQGITFEKARKPDKDLQWILDSVAVQSYAKLGGTPWTIATAQAEPEIVIGIGESRISGNQSNERVFGFTTVFNQNGAYLLTSFGQPVTGFDNYLVSLQTKVEQSIVAYTIREKVAPKRLVVHLYKPSGKRTDALAIENALAKFASSIECAIVHVDHETEFRAFDLNDTHCSPKGRLVIYVDDYQRLVVLSGSEVSWIPPRVASLRLSPQSTYRDLNALTQQVYNFTKVHWAGFQPNNVPVTVKYPAELARMYASLEQLGGDWYGKITDAALLDKAWFL